MSDPNAKSGPLTADELKAIWRSGVDPEYARAFDEAGDGQGAEVYGQAFAQAARASAAIEATTQALYVKPWSGQTSDVALGPTKATVQLTLSRVGAASEPLVVGAGLVWFEEQATEWGDAGTTRVPTARRYALLADLVFLPGELGPFTVSAQAEGPGWGYNNPTPGSISLVDQEGSGLTNSEGSVVVSSSAATAAASLVAVDSPDVVVPQNVGSYVVLTAGSNAGLRARAVGYAAPNPAVDEGGRLALEMLQCFEAATSAGAFVAGETVDLKNAGAVVVGKGRLVAARAGGLGARVGYVLLSGSAAPVGGSIAGGSSGATATVTIATKTTAPVAESLTATWQVLDWALDLGLTVTNAASPTGGRLGFLDQIGAERKIPRGSGESDASYALRVSQLADTVSPNAIRRAANRVLAAVNSAVCLREAGDPLYLPGLFYDAGGSKTGDSTHAPDPFWADPTRMFAYDMDFAVRPSDRFKLYVDSLEMRAFMLVGVPPLQGGETGFFYDGASSDAHPAPNPYDAPASSTPTTFFDGDAPLYAATYRAVWAAVLAAKAAGVGFDAYVEAISCP